MLMTPKWYSRCLGRLDKKLVVEYFDRDLAVKGYYSGSAHLQRPSSVVARDPISYLFVVCSRLMQSSVIFP